MHVRESFTGVVMAVLMTTSGLAANSVVVESRTVQPGATGVVVNVFIDNDFALPGMTLPFEFRSTSGGAFTVNAFEFDTTAGGRVSASGLMDLTVMGFYPEPLLVSDPLQCSGDVVGTYHGSSRELSPANFYTSPDGFIWAGVAFASPYLPAGADGTTPSFSFKFDVGLSAGTFEIDTCCVGPSNHLLFVDPALQGRIPDFTKGVITIPLCPLNYGGAGDLPDCSPCDCHADPRCDGVSDVLDVVTTVGIAFGGTEAIIDPGCPAAYTSDADCDSDTDVFDVVRFVNVAFRNQPPASNFCDPTSQ